MSKYVRTKDGIYKAVIKGLDGFDENEKCILVEEKRQYYLLKKDIIAPSNNLAELCDGFVITYTEFRVEYYVYETLDDIPLLDLKCKNKYFNIYGFIGTDKGLIYVTKMNENRELVLI